MCLKGRSYLVRTMFRTNLILYGGEANYSIRIISTKLRKPIISILIIFIVVLKAKTIAIGHILFTIFV